MNSLVVKFLTRQGCHLCDDARPLVDSVTRRLGVTLLEVDVDGDDMLARLYGERLPVLLGPEGEVLAEGVIDHRGSLARAIRRVRRA